MYKIFKHHKLPCIPCLEETHIKVAMIQHFSFTFFPFFDFAAQPFSTPVTSSNLRNQAPLFTELRRLQATRVGYICAATYILNRILRNPHTQSQNKMLLWAKK